MKYRRKQPTVDAIKYIGANEGKVCEFVGRGELPHYNTGTQLMIPIGGNTGVMILNVGEWVIRHPDHSLSVLDEIRFSKLYEPAE